MTSEADRPPERPAGPDPAPARGPAEVRRLHPAAVAVVAVDSLRQNIVPLVVIGVLAVLGGGGMSGESVARLLVYGGLATAVVAAVGYARWVTTTYWVDDAVHRRSGVLERKQAAVPIERISAIDTLQGPVHRLFGVTELQIHAAGGGQEPEITLAALSSAGAEELRRGVARAGASADAVDERPPRAPVRRLSRRELLVAGATSGQFTVLLPLLAAAGQALDRVLGPNEGEAIRRYLPPETVGIAIVAAAALLAVAWLLAFLGTIVAFAGFSVERDQERLRIARGFLQRRVSTVPVARVQAIRVVEGVLRQPLGLASLRVESAGYASERSENTTLFPLLARSEVERFLREAVPELAGELEPLTPPPRRAGWLYVGTPALAATLVAVPAAILWSPLAVLVVPAAAMLGVARQRAAGYRVEDRLLVVRARRLARTTILAAGLRLPERTFAQGPLARRLGLATLAFALASRTRWAVAHLEVRWVLESIDALRPPLRGPAPLGGSGRAGDLAGREPG